MTRIATTHVGSLPRSQEVVDFIFAREKEKPYDTAAFDAAMTKAVDATVARQKQAGVDIVSDGETSKISYATYVKDRYTGFSGDSPRNAPADLKLFPGFLQRLSDEGGTPQYARPMCTGEVRSKGQGELGKDIDNLKAAMANNGADRGFMNAASPGVISLFLQNAHYPTREAYLAALADAMREEYETIVAAGLDLQLDCPDLALSRHMLFTDLSDEEFVKVAQMHVEALNHALANVPQEKVRVHICWGTYEGPHVCDIDMAKVFPVLMQVKAQYLLFETSNPRHAHEWTVFRDRRNEIPDDRVLVPRGRHHHEFRRASRTGGAAIGASPTSSERTG
ncbi:MAG: epoxyalkane--coenzyme M transferase [Nitratireductor sp.]